MIFDDRGQGALPKLYGAPAYSRPPAVVAARAEPLRSPDDLPLEAERTVEERDLAQHLVAGPSVGTATTGPAPVPARSHGAAGVAEPPAAPQPRRSGGPAPLARPFRIGALGGRRRGRPGDSSDADA